MTHIGRHLSVSPHIMLQQLLNLYGETQSIILKFVKV